MLMEISCACQAEVETFAGQLSTLVCAGDIIALSGDLGAGKTTFARAFIRSLLDDVNAEVPSPTFTLVQLYETDDFPVYHTDLYRLQEPDDVYDLGLDDERSEAVLLVEWPDRMPKEWGQGALEVTLTRPKGAAMGEDEARNILLNGEKSIWQPRLSELQQ